MDELMGLEGRAAMKARKEGRRGKNPMRIAARSAKEYADTGSSRIAFMQHMETREFDKSLAAKIKSNDARLVDEGIYSVKKLEKVVKFFNSADQKDFGITNLDGSRLPKGEAMVVTAIVLLRAEVAASGATPTTDEIKQAVFGEWKGIKGDALAVVTAKAHKKEIVSELPCYSFLNEVNTQVSYHQLENPRLIKDEGEIEVELTMPTMTSIPANTYVCAMLIGTRAIPR